MAAKIAEELLQMRRREPFQPFRVYDKDGEVYDVLNPEECMVTDFVVVLPVRVPDPNDPDAGYPAAVELGNVARIEMIARAPFTNGPRRP
ncbi:MAG TPA: hypothetical protein VMS17_19075 [Gemmataceae bacterium]|nr:hypothetical protein [Gemmataceae bacterium]